MPCTPPEPLSPGFDGARLVEGVAALERPDGRAGCYTLPPGWYYSDTGRQRLVETVDRWGRDLEAMEQRLAVLSAPRPLVPSPPAPAHVAPLALFSALVLGLLLGLALGRRWRP